TEQDSSTPPENGRPPPRVRIPRLGPSFCTADTARALISKYAMTTRLTPADFDYCLPPELIAQHPASQRTASRLLRLDAAGGLHDLQFTDLLEQLRPHDLLVFNDTRVIKARLLGHKHSGGKVEVLVERVTGETRALDRKSTRLNSS